jgi:protein AroM
MKKIGMLTIGQAPRDDLIPGLMEILGEGYEVFEAGALDDVTLDEVKQIPLIKEDYILVSRMRDGTEIKITKKYILPLLQRKLEEIEAQGIRLTVVMCTGKFPQFKSKGLVVTPMEILQGVLKGCLKEGRLGVIYPTVEQVEKGYGDWGRPGVEVYGDTVSPYEAGDVEALAGRLAEQDLDVVLLNCFGFPSEVKQVIAKKTGVPVIQANAVVARVLKELVS